MFGNVAYIGYGFVGKACHKAFEHNTVPVIVDPKYSDVKVEDLVHYNPGIVFVAVNAPTLENGKVDVTNIHNVLEDLSDIEYNGPVVIKSTLPPSELTYIFQKYPLKLVYSPEFLRERFWEEDALKPVMVLLGGDFKNCKLVEDIYKKHSNIDLGRVTFHITLPEDAALVKYAINTFLATKVVFFNQIYQVFKDMNNGVEPQWEDWQHIVRIVGNDPRIGFSHMQVPGPDDQYGYGGSCFPKDVKAFIGEDVNNHLSLLKEVELANTKLRLLGKLDD